MLFNIPINILKILLISSILSLNLNADQKNPKVIFDLTTKSLKTFDLRIFSSISGTYNYYDNEFKTMKTAVMIHGGSYKFFLKNPSKSKWGTDQELAKSLKDISNKIHTLYEIFNVEFLICNAGLKKHGIKKSDLYDFVQVIPNATIGLVNKQNSGYAYIPVSD